MNETTILASTLSPEFIGMPTAPKAGEDADENQIANVGYVKDLVGSTVGVDDELSTESEHAVQNKVITAKFESVDEAIADETLRATLAESALDTRIDEVIAGEAVFAPLDSPVFTGNPTVPNIDNNSTDFTIVNKKYVDDTEANYYINYNDVSITVQEIKTAIDQGKNLFCVETDTNNVKHIYPIVYTEDPEYDPPELTLKFSDGVKDIDLFISTTTIEWATASKSDSPIFTGTPQAPTAPAGTNTNQIATTAFVNDALTNSDAMRKGIDYVTAGYKSGTEIGLKATAEGNDVESSGDYSHAEGNQTVASGEASHSEGNFTVASGDFAHAEGNDTTASGDSSHAEGEDTVAVGNNSHAEGLNTNATGDVSHAEGSNTVASGDYAHTEGVNTVANHKSQHVFGEFNTADPSQAESTERGDYIEIVGNGASANSTSNARTLDWQGNEILAGKLTVGAEPTADNDVATKKYVDDRLNPELPNVTNVDDGKVLTVVDGQWDKAEPQSGSELPEVTSADNGKILTVVEGQWDKAEPSDNLSPVVIKLGVDDIELNSSNYRFTLSNDNVIALVHEALMSAYHNKRPVYFDITYHETGYEDAMYLNGYASIHGHADMGTDSVNAVFSTWNRRNTLIYDFVVYAGYYGSDLKVDMSLKARS